MEEVKEEAEERDPDMEWSDENWVAEAEEDGDDDETWGRWGQNRNWAWGWDDGAHNHEETKQSRSWNKKLGALLRQKFI